MNYKLQKVPGEPKKKVLNEYGEIELAFSPRIIIGFFFMIGGLLVALYLLGLSNGRNESNIDYSYLDKFTEYLIETSEAYDNSSEEFMKAQYEIWATNNGYVDIIIGANGELEDAFGGTDNMIITTDPSELNQGIYIYNDDEFSHVIVVSMTDLSRGRLTIIRAKLTDSEYHSIFSTSISAVDENKYKLYDSEDMYFEFTDYGTVILTNGEDEGIIDQHTYPDAFVGEYVPIHSY